MQPLPFHPHVPAATEHIQAKKTTTTTRTILIKKIQNPHTFDDTKTSMQQGCWPYNTVRAFTVAGERERCDVSPHISSSPLPPSPFFFLCHRSTRPLSTHTSEELCVAAPVKTTARLVKQTPRNKIHPPPPPLPSPPPIPPYSQQAHSSLCPPPSPTRILSFPAEP